jgi:putative DNA primase/helicase
VSVSGTGVHAIAFGALDPTGPNKKDGVEVYDRRRYLTFTGHRLLRAPPTVESREPVLRAIQDRLRDRRQQVAPTSAGQGFNGPDKELLERAFAPKNGAKVRAHWHGERVGKPSASEALLALARLLAFYTGPDVQILYRPLSLISFLPSTCSTPGGVPGVLLVVSVGVRVSRGSPGAIQPHRSTQV